jgi:O-antigen ligase
VTRGASDYRGQQTALLIHEWKHEAIPPTYGGSSIVKRAAYKLYCATAIGLLSLQVKAYAHARWLIYLKNVDSHRLLPKIFMQVTRDRFFEFVAVWALSLVPVILVFPSHIKAITYLALLLCAIYLLYTNAEVRKTYSAFKSTALAFALYLPYSLASIWLQNGSWPAADNGMHFLFFVVIAVCFHKLGSKQLFWAGIGAAAFGAGALALYQRFGLHIERPYGLYGFREIGSGAIKFAMVATVFSLLALVAALDKHMPAKTRLWCGIAALIGFAGCQVIGSRGPWLTLVVIGIGITMRSIFQLDGRRRKLAVILALVLSTILLSSFHAQLHHLLILTSNEIASIRSGNFNTSIGHRIEMWRAAIIMFVEHPFFGIGMDQFGEHLHEMANSGRVAKFVGVYNAAHNEYLHALATGGIVGLVYLLWLFGAPLVFFLQELVARNAKGEETILPVSGLIIVASFALFSTTDTIFDRQMTTSLFAFLTLGFAVMTAHPKGSIYAEKNRIAYNSSPGLPGQEQLALHTDDVTELRSRRSE